MRRIGARKAGLVEQGVDFLLRRLRIAQPAGMPKVKIDDDVMVCRHFRDQRKHRPHRLGEPGIFGVGGEDVDALPFMIVFSRYIALPVHRQRTKVLGASGSDNIAG